MSREIISNNEIDNLINETLSDIERDRIHMSITETEFLDNYIERCAESFCDVDFKYAELLLGEDLETEIQEYKEAFEDHDDNFITNLGIGGVIAGGAAKITGLFAGTPIHIVAANNDNEINHTEFDRMSHVDDSITYINSIDMDNNTVQQQYSDTCAIKSQQLILNDFGINVTEDQLVQYSMEKGWYNGDGTQMENVGNILTDFGVPITQISDANIYTLVGELAQGHKVIVGVDSDELWNKGIMTSAKDIFIGETPNHALIVSGIDTTDPDNVKVLITDPGTGDLCKEYPLDQFMDAWQDSNCFMVTTEQPAPLEYNPEMINFDYNLGHLSQIGDMPYEEYIGEFIDSSANLHNGFLSDNSIMFDTVVSDIYGADLFTDTNEAIVDEFKDINDGVDNDDFDNLT